MSPRHAWLDGRLVQSDEPHLRVTDRGFQLGDAVFETLRARRGVAIEWPDHADRLAQSAATLGIALDLPSGALLAAVKEVLAAEGLAGDGREAGTSPGDAAVRITVSRGQLEGRGLLPAGWDTARPTIVVQAWPYAPPPAALLERGASAILSSVRRDPASPLAGVKSTSRADHVYAKIEALRAGADDALFVTIDGRLSEATAANLFLVRGEALITPSTAGAVLRGTTRTWLLTAAAVPDLGLAMVEADVDADDLRSADEAFLTSSVAGIVPLTSFAGHSIGGGAPGRRTMELRTARERWIDEQALDAIEATPAAPADGTSTPTLRG